MASTSCPCCGHRTGSFEIKKGSPIAYCNGCGWNVGRAQMSLVSRRRSFCALLALLTVVMLLPAAVFSPHRIDAVAGWVTILAFFIFLLVRAERKIAHDEGWRSAISNQFNRCYPQQRIIPEPNATTTATCARLRALPMPREVESVADARHARFVTKVLPIGFWMIGIHELLFPYNPIGLAARTPFQARLAGLFFIAAGYAMWIWCNRLFQDRRAFELLTKGNVALGRVTGSLRSIMTKPGITYEFRDLQGLLWHGKGERVEKEIEEDSYVIVFYDPNAPQNSAAIDATYYELLDQSQPEALLA